MHVIENTRDLDGSKAVTRDFSLLRSPTLEGMKMARPAPHQLTMLLFNLLI